MASKKEIEQAKQLAKHLYNDAKFHDDGCNIKDSYHTMSELYFNRMILFDLLMKSHPEYAWKSKLHSDGTMFPDYFIVGFTFKDETSFTYHFHLKYWDIFSCIELERAPEYDGHLPQDIHRLYKLFEDDKEDKYKDPCYFLNKWTINEIAKLYNQNINKAFAGHAWNDHIVKVIKNAQELCRMYNVNYTIEIEIGAALHDIGLKYGRENHEINGMIEAQKLFDKGIFNEYNLSNEDIDFIKNIIRYHRASSDFSNIPNVSAFYIVNLADKDLHNKSAYEIFLNAFKRTYKSAYFRQPTREERLVDVRNHLTNKYGLNGYLYNNPYIKKLNINEEIEHYIHNMEFDQNVINIVEEIENSKEEK